MILPNPDAKVFLYADFVDMRKSINGLATLIEEQTSLSPFDCKLFVFCNRKRDKVKLLYWEKNGFILWYKRLKKFRFKWPGKDAPEVVDGELLNRLLDGYDSRPQRSHPVLEYTTLL